MIKHTLPFLLVGAALLMPALLSGKAETARVTIAGAGLASPIEITDANVLQASHAWGSEFLDTSRPPLTRAPKIRSRYEVTFYSRIADNDIRKTCVFFYSPSPEAAQGIIYLPPLNTGTIMREGRDRKWSYASPAWEALIKPYIASAEAGRGRTAASTSEIVVDNWTKPLPGWLYVLDPRSDPSSPGSRVWLLDPETAMIRGSVRTGYDPDCALSPDGSRLFIASGERESGELAVMDTATGNIHHIPYPDRVLYRPWYDGLPPFSPMAMTPDGRSLWISGQHLCSPDRIEMRLSVFDTQTEKFLNTTVDLDKCDYGDFVAASGANQLDFWCAAFADSTPVSFVRLDAGRGAVSSTSAGLPISRGCGLAEAFRLPGGNKIAIIRTDGAVYEMDTATQKVRPTSATGSCHEWTLAHAGWPHSADGAKVYLGYGGVAPNGMSAASELRVFDTTQWIEAARVQTSVPFWSAVVSQDGKHIYAIAPEQHGIVVFRADTLQEKQFMLVGNTPSLAIVAPNLATNNRGPQPK